MDVPKDQYESIAREIESDKSPVGIDAKKTHILILHKLAQIEKKLIDIEARLTSSQSHLRADADDR